MKFEQHLFISDVHLGAFPDEKNHQIEEDLISLIHFCKEHRIYLNVLGDLFDYWMEFPKKDFIPELGKNVLNAFEDYNKSLAPALYITGNHDNWTFGHFKERGFDVESEFRIKNIHNKRFLLMHGDGMRDSKFNFPRPSFHKFLRNKTFIRAFQKVLSPKIGLAAMKLFSSITRRRDPQNREVLNHRAKEIFSSNELDYIITGHDHIPRVETFSGQNYTNLGTFFNHRTVGLYNNNDGLKLVKWKADSKNFVPFEGNK